MLHGSVLLLRRRRAPARHADSNAVVALKPGLGREVFQRQRWRYPWAAMPWDTEETKRRLKQAATEEFAEHGPEGTSMEQIAKRAGINKERLYNYFGDKERL